MQDHRPTTRTELTRHVSMDETSHYHWLKNTQREGARAEFRTKNGGKEDIKAVLVLQ